MVGGGANHDTRGRVCSPRLTAWGGIESGPAGDGGRGSARNDDPSPSLVGAERSRVGIGLGLGVSKADDDAGTQRGNASLRT